MSRAFRKTFGLGLSLVFGVTVLWVSAPKADAGAALNALVLNQANELEDDNWETSLGARRGDTVLDVGDVLFGMVEITAIQGTSSVSLGATFTAVFAIKVTSKSALAGNTVAIFGFGPPSDTDWSAIAADVAGWPARSSSSTMVITYEDVGVDPPAGAPHFIDPSSLSVTSVTGDGIPLWEFGFTGSPGETWVAVTVSPSGNADNLAAADLSGSFSARLNVTHEHPAVAGLELLRVVPDPAFPAFVVDKTGANPLGAQLHITGGSLTKSGGTHSFPVKSDADFWIVPTPEPGSFVLLAGLTALAGVGYLRRQPKATSL
jgi:hypothetical protein